MASASEFVVSDAYHYDRRSTTRWLFSHIIRYKFVFLAMCLGALLNAGGAFLVPALIGVAFTAVIQPKPDLNTVAWCAVLLVGSQVIRGLVMLGRNVSAET